MRDEASLQRAQNWELCRACLIGAGVLVAVLAGVMAWFIVDPMLAGATAAKAEAPALKLPPYDLSAWRHVPVQMSGRVMPFETAAVNALRQITGRSKFEKTDAVAIVLSWMMTKGGTDGVSSQLTNWEETPVILCDDPRLRGPILAEVFGDKPIPEDVLHGKYLAPKQIRNSKRFREFVLAGEEKMRRDRERGGQSFEPEERGAEEVKQRLHAYDSFTQGDPIVGEQRRHLKPDDPLHLAALDKVAGSAWLSLGEMAQCVATPEAWRTLLEKRVTATPHLYLAPEERTALKRFQDAVRDGREQEVLDELDKKLKRERTAKVAAFRALAAEDKTFKKAHAFLESEVLRKEDDQAEFERVIKSAKPDPKSDKDPLDQLAEQIDTILAKSDAAQVARLAGWAADARKKGYVPEKDEFRTMHMTYLNTLDRTIYQHAVEWQPFPQAKAQKLLADYAELRQAYISVNAQNFSEASQRFMNDVAAVSQEAEATYPTCNTLDLELTFNKAEPFKWAWVSMALATLCFALSLGFASRIPYLAGFAFFAVSLACQGLGFYSRIAISGRPPVTNMYETVIFVASMASLFALVLELVYRPRYIVLAGSIVATIGLVLADQLPVSRGFDSAIQPLVPVLRSNFWLIIHVMTIVASYAAGALAWSMGNIVLFMFYFRDPKPEQLKKLSMLTYRSMQIAVLLLAAGTFLGGWWAAYSWGRFWGWDPKETWALIALIAYVIPLHARYIGWVKDFGLAVSAVVCFAAIVMSWYGVNFILGAGLHSYGFGGGGPYYVYLGCLLNLLWVVIVCLKHAQRQLAAVQMTA